MLVSSIRGRARRMLARRPLVPFALGLAALAAPPIPTFAQSGGARTKEVPEPTFEMQLVLDKFYFVLRPRPIETLPPAEARQQPTVADAVKRALLDQGRDTSAMVLVPGVTSVDRTIPGPGGALPVRIFTPDGPGPFPVIVYFHGGGWVIGSKEVYDGGARGLSKEAQAVVMSVDYRLAPENKFPAQHDDAFASYKWALDNAASINGDPTRVALAGESAGGNLAVATAVQARDAGLRLPPHILSVYPIAQTSLTTDSYLRNANARPLNRAMMEYFFTNTIRSPADLNDPRINLVAADLHGLPSVTIIAAEIDPLRDDGVLLARALERARVKVKRIELAGVTHEFFGGAAVVRDAAHAQYIAGQRFQEAFARWGSCNPYHGCQKHQ